MTSSKDARPRDAHLRRHRRVMKRILACVIILFAAINLAWAAWTNPPFVAIEYAYQEARDFHEGLAAVKQNNRWGYIDNLGRVAIPFVYNTPEAGDFSEGVAFVGDHYIDTSGNPAFVRPDDDSRAWGHEKWGTDGQEKYFNNGMAFSQGLAAVQSGGQWGYIDLSGNYAIAPIFERADSFSEGLAAVRKNGHWGYINLRGKLVIPHRFIRANRFSEGKAMVNLNGRRGFINKSGDIVIKPTYYEAGDFSFGLAPVRTRTSYRGWGFISPRNRFAIPRRYNNAKNFGEGLAPAAADARWGYIDVRGDWEIAPQFDDARPFSEGMAAVKQDGKWGYIRQ